MKKLFLVILIGFLAVSCNTNTKSEVMKKSSDSDVMVPKTDNMMEKDDTTMTNDSKMMDESMQSSKYQDYSIENLDKAQAEGKKVVLFFHAKWCPYCVAADGVFSSMTDKIPDGYVVLKTNYDTETQLKNKYMVNYQHTFVQIDNEANLVTKWVSGDVDLLVKNVK